MSLTKKHLIEAIQASEEAKVHELGEFFGETVYVKQMSELQRSRRMTSMINKEGNGISEKFKERNRIYAIIDYICDKDGKALYKESDCDDLLKLNFKAMNPLIEAIQAWVEALEGNE